MMFLFVPVLMLGGIGQSEGHISLSVYKFPHSSPLLSLSLF